MYHKVFSIEVFVACFIQEFVQSGRTHVRSEIQFYARKPHYFFTKFLLVNLMPIYPNQHSPHRKKGQEYFYSICSILSITWVPRCRYIIYYAFDNASLRFFFVRYLKLVVCIVSTYNMLKLCFSICVYLNFFGHFAVNCIFLLRK